MSSCQFVGNLLCGKHGSNPNFGKARVRFYLASFGQAIFSAESLLFIGAQHNSL